jgi:hypothetical protein
MSMPLQIECTHWLRTALHKTVFLSKQKKIGNKKRQHGWRFVASLWS